MRDRPHAPHQPSSVTLRITGHQSSPAGRAVGAPVIELSTRSTAFPLFSPARRAREPCTSLDFLHRRVGAFRLCLVPVHSVPSSVRLPRIDAASSEGSSAGAAGCLRRGRTLAPVRFRLVVAHRSRGSHLQQSRPRPPATPHSWPRFRLETPLPYGSGVWRRLLSNRPSILGQFDARPPPLHQAKLGTGRVAKH